MQTLQLPLDQRRVQKRLLEVLATPTMPSARRLQYLGAKAAGVAQRMRQTLIGDAEETDRLLAQNQVKNPAARLAADLEIAHMQLAMAAGRVLAYSMGGLRVEEQVDLYCRAMTTLVELHNSGVTLYNRATGDARTNLAELLEPLHEELKEASILFRKRFLGIF
jgi:hypothetical protein